MHKVLIDGSEFVAKAAPLTIPQNDICATHWAALPDGQILFYRVGNDVRVWLPFSKIWISPNTVPYTLYCFND